LDKDGEENRITKNKVIASSDQHIFNIKKNIHVWYRIHAATFVHPKSPVPFLHNSGLLDNQFAHELLQLAAVRQRTEITTADYLYTKLDLRELPRL